MTTRKKIMLTYLKIIIIAFVSMASITFAIGLAFIPSFWHQHPSYAPPAATTPEAMRTQALYEYEGIDPDELSERERDWYLIDGRAWPKAAYTPASATGELIERWRQESLRDPDVQLDAKRREALLRTLAEHASARARPTPDAYIELIEGQSGADWNDAATLREHPQVLGAYRAFVEADIDEDADALSILRTVWGGLAEHDHLFEDVGVGEEGAVLLVRRLRTVREAMTLGFSGKHALIEKRWNGVYFQGGMPFAVEDLTLEQTLQEAPSALVVNAHVLVRMGDGRYANWISVWFYDETADRWRTHYMQMSAPTLAKVVR